jgi:hypothetical protein
MVHHSVTAKRVPFGEATSSVFAVIDLYVGESVGGQLRSVEMGVDGRSLCGL